MAQDQVGGLEVLSSSGEWVSAVPLLGTFIVKIGGQMARWANDIFASTVHRAINQLGQERYSMPYSLRPNYDTLIETLPSCMTLENPVKYQLLPEENTLSADLMKRLLAGKRVF